MGNPAVLPEYRAGDKSALVRLWLTSGGGTFGKIFPNMETWQSGLMHYLGKVAYRNVPEVRILSFPLENNLDKFAL